MSTDQKDFMSAPRLPARLTAQETGWFMGFTLHQISILASLQLLKPCGRPSPNGTKYFATATLERLRNDPRWLDKACDAIAAFWRIKNSRRTGLRRATEGRNRNEFDFEEIEAEVLNATQEKPPSRRSR